MRGGREGLDRFASAFDVALALGLAIVRTVAIQNQSAACIWHSRRMAMVPRKLMA